MSLPHRLTLRQMTRALQARTLTSEQLVRSCLEHIAAVDPQILAWASLEPEAALARAKQLDNEPLRGLLHGIPIGVKDVIDTVDFPTCYNSPIYQHHRPASNAAIVTRALEAGAIILGKTTTQEFATRGTLSPTRNPHSALHTPGGSSSGSAAAVGSHMIPLALSTQTAGSIVRPASYCGVVGFKASHGLNMRFFEVLATASVLLTDEVAEIDRHFEPDVDLVVYTDTAQLQQKLQLLLASPELRQRISAIHTDKPNSPKALTPAKAAMCSDACGVEWASKGHNSTRACTPANAMQAHE